MFKFFILAVFSIQILVVKSKKGYGPGEQDWGFAEVRSGAYMFYWLYYADIAEGNYTSRPLVIWLQGGPGVSGSYYSNFFFLGPLDEDLNERNSTWTQYVNVLFVDSPVGAGFSYVRTDFKYPQNNRRMALDLVELMKVFYKSHPEFVGVPVHIFGESYGGKTAVEFALEFHRAHSSGHIRSATESVSIINSWISPKDSWTEGPAIAYYLGVISKNEFETLNEKVEEFINYDETMTCSWLLLNSILEEQKLFCNYTNGVNIFNANYLVHIEDTQSCGIGALSDNETEIFMNGPVSEALNITEHKWKQMWSGVLQVTGDVCKPVIHIVNELLSSTSVHVNVLSGSYDIVNPTVSTLKWIEKLAWNSKDDYDKAPRKPIFVNGILQGYEKVGRGLSMYWVHRSGHWIARDNPVALNYVLKYVTKIGD